MPIDASQLERYLDLLEAGGDAIDRDLARALAHATGQLRIYAQSIAHRVTGFMADSMYEIGLSASGAGIIESEIASLASYTLKELDRGGDHDWASRTLAEDAAVLLALELEVSAIVESHL